jgi:CubicO group peptidase (beta-lactamase class C family)
MTKAVTTVAIMQLYEQGKLGIDDPVQNYIPAFKDAQVLDTFNEKDSSYTTVRLPHPSPSGNC